MKLLENAVSSYNWARHCRFAQLKRQWKGPKQEWDKALEALHDSLDKWLERPRATEVKLVAQIRYTHDKVCPVHRNGRHCGLTGPDVKNMLEEHKVDPLDNSMRKDMTARKLAGFCYGIGVASWKEANLHWHSTIAWQLTYQVQHLQICAQTCHGGRRTCAEANK